MFSVTATHPIYPVISQLVNMVFKGSAAWNTSSTGVYAASVCVADFGLPGNRHWPLELARWYSAVHVPVILQSHNTFFFNVLWAHEGMVHISIGAQPATVFFLLDFTCAQYKYKYSLMCDCSLWLLGSQYNWKSVFRRLKNSEFNVTYIKCIFPHCEISKFFRLLLFFLLCPAVFTSWQPVLWHSNWELIVICQTIRRPFMMQ